MNSIPEKLNAFNMYNEGEKMIGITGEVELPSFEATTSTVNGAGILGEVDSPNFGHFGSIKQVIPYQTISSDAMNLFESRDQTITLRGDMIYHDTAQGKYKHKGLRVVMRGVPASYKTGKASAGSATDSEITLELSYIKIELDGLTLVELDKYNFIYVVNGKDQLAETRNNI